MNPNQPYVPPPSNNPYDFILNPAPKTRKGIFGMLGNSFVRTIVLLVGGAFVLMTIVAILLNSFGGNKVNTEDLVSLAQTQTEIIRVSRQGSGTSLQGTRSLATTVEYTTKTQLQQVITLLNDHGRKIKASDKELTLKQDATTDQKFTTAKQTSSFDLVYAQVMQSELEAYSRELQTLLKRSTNADERELLSSYNEQTQLLLTQIPYTQKDILNNQ